MKKAKRFLAIFLVMVLFVSNSHLLTAFAAEEEIPQGAGEVSEAPQDSMLTDGGESIGGETSAEELTAGESAGNEPTAASSASDETTAGEAAGDNTIADGATGDESTVNEATSDEPTVDEEVLVSEPIDGGQSGQAQTPEASGSKDQTDAKSQENSDQNGEQAADKENPMTDEAADDQPKINEEAADKQETAKEEPTAVEAAGDEPTINKDKQPANNNEQTPNPKAESTLKYYTPADAIWANEDLYLTGMIPEGAIVEAKPVKVEIDGQEVLAAYDIKIYENEEKQKLEEAWQPEDDKVQVHFFASEAGDEVNAYHIPDESDEPELVDTVAAEDGWVEFDAESFSIYALTSEYLRTYRFLNYQSSSNRQYVEYKIFTDQGTKTYTQTIKNGERLVIPQLPALAESADSTFTGWYAASGVQNNDGVYTYASISDEPFDFENIPEITRTETVYLFARYSEFAYVVFHDQYNGAAGGFPVAFTQRGEKIDGTATVKISDFSVSYDDSSSENTAPSMSFYGWSLTPITTPGAAKDDLGNPVSRIESDSVTISGADTYLDLYPVFRPIHWLNFHSGPAGSGATYIPSAYYYEGEGRTQATVPVRSGYRFTGWYTGSVNDTGASKSVNYKKRITDEDGKLIEGASDDGIQVKDGTLLLSQNSTLYAKWEESSVYYTIVIWRQKVTDEPGLSDDKKTYDYAQSISLTGTTGQVISVGNAYKSYGGQGDYEGFSYSRCDDSKTIASDGSMVLNVYYDRNVHTIRFRASTSTSSSSNQSSPVVNTVTALYGADISGIWSFTGSNGISYPVSGRNSSWYPFGSNTFKDRLTKIMTMPDEDLQFYHYITSNTTRYFHFYVEALPGAQNTRTFNGREYSLYAELTNDFNRLYRSIDFWELTGFSQDKIATASGADVTAKVGENTAWESSWNNNLYFYYDRESYEIAFLDAYTSSYAYVDGEQLGDQKVLYEDRIADAVPADPEPVQIAGDSVLHRDGYRFTGWYTDEACSTRAFFEDNEAYRSYEGSKVLYETMPAHNLRFYAGWDTIWYLIQIDPNYGTMNNGSSDSTWFWEPYNGDPIEEYTWVRRDYEESITGEYYYVKHDRAHYGYTDEFAPNENEERHAYFTTNPGEATELTTYKYAENAYRYAGWYEIHEDGSESLYHFGEPVTHDIRLILHWKKIGTYNIRYNALVEQDGKEIAGTLDGGDLNESLFVDLDTVDYADNAEIILTRSAKAPEGYSFIGWKIRGDESGRLYYPGEPFRFRSTYAVTITEQGVEYETIFLDAVYRNVETARIVYHANGGTIDAQAVDYGSARGETSLTPMTEANAAEGTCTIWNLESNNGIILSDGTGFSMAGAELVGWNTEPDASGTHFDLGADEYNVDTRQPQTLYAEWRVKVYYHLNKPAGEANFGGRWDPKVYTQEEETLYARYAFVGQSIEKPAPDPVYTGAENLFFHYWGTQRYGDDELIEEYDFDSPISGTLHLYAYWAGPIEVPVHALDASSQTLASMDSAWLGNLPIIEVGAESVPLGTIADAKVYAPNVPEGYEYAFAAVHDSTGSIQEITEQEAATELFYHTDEKKVFVRYADGHTAPLADEDEIYLVFFQKKDLPIGYLQMSTDGSLSAVSISRQAPASTGALGAYQMAEALQTPLRYPVSGSYTYYAYAFGERNAENASQLRLISAASGSDSSRPALQVQNTWRGFVHSTDGGSTWSSCGYDFELYVIYFLAEEQPVIVTVSEQTIGTRSDLEKTFEYALQIMEETKTYVRTDYATRSGYFSYSYDIQLEGDETLNQSGPATMISENTFELADDQTQTVTLFGERTESYGSWSSRTTRYNGRNYYTRTVTITEKVQTMRIVQTSYQSEGFVTTNDGESGDQQYQYMFTASRSSSDQTVTFTNVHEPLSLDVHVAIVRGDDIVLDDSLRSKDHTLLLTLGQKKVFLNEIPAESLFTGDSEMYSFAGIISGTTGSGQDSLVKAAHTSVESIGYTRIGQDEDIYELCLNEDASLPLGEGQIYYLYYPMPKVVYVKESAGGELTRITGKDGGDVTYNGSALVLNGGLEVHQDQKLSLESGALTISQNVGAGNFNMPPRLDDGDEKLFLLYAKLGVGADGLDNISELDAWSEERTLRLKTEEDRVKWSMDGTTWHAFGEAPTIYAIYHEIGYDLTIKKSLDGGDTSRSFTLIIESPAITQTSYQVKGTGNATIQAIPADGSTPGRIQLTIRHGSEITISGLGRGDYTLTETGSGFELYAASIGEKQQTIKGNGIAFSLQDHTSVSLSNRLSLPAPTGLDTDRMPYWWLIAAGAVLGGSGIWFYIRRRRKEEEE